MAMHSIVDLACDRHDIYPGGIVLIRWRCVDVNGSPMTPATSRKIEIYDPNGDAIVPLTSTGVTTVVTGEFTYKYQTVTTKRAGKYSLLVVTDDTDIQKLGLPDAFETMKFQ